MSGGTSARASRSPGLRTLATIVCTLLVVGTVGTYLARRGTATWSATPRPFEDALAHRGAIAVVGALADLGAVEGITARRIRRGDALDRALRGVDGGAVRDVLRDEGMRALVISTAEARRAPEDSVLGRFGRFGVVAPFRTFYLDAGRLAVEPYALPPMSDAVRASLARVARQMLTDGTQPRLGQFPSPLRAPFPCEVAVMFRRRAGDLALWRSARASSIASGLLTSVGVARQRWETRGSTLGEPLEREIGRLGIEVALLVDDGTLGSRDAAFLDAAITEQHGPAYDQTSAWRYLLPEARRTGGRRSGSQAFGDLFRDNRMPVDSVRRRDLRLYRMRVELLATSSSTGR